jgi:hypothetical protein
VDGTARDYESVAMSADGKYQTAVTDDSGIWRSTASSSVPFGNIGIGTTSPAYTLDIATTTSSRGLNIDNTQTSTSNVYGVYANTNVTDGTYSANSFGGYFKADQTNALNSYGVYGVAEGSGWDGQLYGVYGEASNGSGVYGTGVQGGEFYGTTYGVYSGSGANYFAGDIVGIKGLTYSWPSAHATNGYLKDDGAGNLSWTTSLTATSTPFSGLTSGTNTQAIMTVGTGASLTYSGKGVINASQLLGGTWGVPGGIGSTTPNTGAFTILNVTKALPSFATKTDFPTGATSGPHSITVGDLSGDGIVDMATANQSNSTVSVFINNGVGTSFARTNLTTGTSPDSVAMGDLSGDGKTDLALTNFNSNTVSVFTNNGVGTSFARTDYPTVPGSNPESVAIGDLSNDGKADMVVGNGSSSVSVFINNGVGTSYARTEYATGNYPLTFALGDLNGDSINDMITANYIANTVSVLINNGVGTSFARTD